MVIDSDTDLSEIATFPKIVTVARWFRCFAGAQGRLPTRRDINPADFPEILGHQMISELHRDRQDGRIRMLGTVAETFSGLRGHSSGRWFSEVLDRTSAEQAVTACITALEQGSPLFGLSNYCRKDGLEMTYARLICPLGPLPDEPETLFTIFEMIPGNFTAKSAYLKMGKST